MHLRAHGFEIFGYDFMVDRDFKVWLIEVNTNPCLDTAPVHLARIIPAMIENALKIVLDPMFIPKKPRDVETVNENRWELVYNLATEAESRVPVKLVSEGEEEESDDERTIRNA